MWRAISYKPEKTRVQYLINMYQYIITKIIKTDIFQN